MSYDLSIIVPAHNEESYIGAMLASIYKNLAASFEVILVDNGSTDHTLEIAQTHPVQIIKIPQKVFPSKARNIGARMATGKVLVFLDADIVVTPEWCNELKHQFPALLDTSHYILTGDQYQISQSGSWVESNWFLPLRKSPKNYINGGNIILSRSLFELTDGFDESLETGEDVDFCARAKTAGACIVFNENFYTYHEGFPKTLPAFIKRERWHGKGDFTTWSKFITSRIALITVLFFTIHVLLLLTMLFGASISYAFSLLFLIIAITAASSYWRMKNQPFKIFVSGFVLSYFYFVGRSLSFIDVIKCKAMTILH